jgi:replication factor A1
MKIVELKPGMRRVEITAKVIEKSDPREVTTRFGDTSRVATAVVQDDSGTIKLSLWNETIDQVNVNDTVKIENGYVTAFRGETQLNVGRYGRLSVVG